MSYLNRLSQNVIADTNNSSTGNLSGGATFTGVGSSTLGVAGIQVSLKTDQNCTVYIEQSPNNTNWDISDEYHYNKVTNNFGITVQAINSYVRVRVTNLNSTTATSYFRLQTALCPIVEAVPRSLDDHGLLKVGLYDMYDEYGFRGSFSPNKDLRVASPTRLIGTLFGSSIDTRFWTASNSGTASGATVVNNVATLTSGTSNNGYGQITSFRSARFIIAQPNLFRASLRLPDITEAGNTRRWGAFTVSTTTPQDGHYFEVDEAGVLSVVCVKSGTPNSVSSGNFNGEVSEYTLDTNIHSYEIIYSINSAHHFFIDGVLIHKFSTSTAPLVDNYNCPITITSINGAGGTESADIECLGATVLRLGNLISQPSSYYHANGQTAGTQLKIGAGNIHSIIIGNITNGSVVTLSDSTTTSTPVIFSFTGSNTANMGTSIPSALDLKDIPFFTGLRLTVATQNAQLTIVYE